VLKRLARSRYWWTPCVVACALTGLLNEGGSTCHVPPGEFKARRWKADRQRLRNPGL
jgi:hypothetical protein